MKLAHLSDLHCFVPPTLRGMVGKRLLGMANLYVKGRRHHFREDVAVRAFQQVVALKPDAVLLTGDLTALASPLEFERARQVLAPLLDAVPTVIIPGNHDTYTQRAAREKRIEGAFAPWIFAQRAEEQHLAPGGSFPTLHLLPGVAVLGLDACQFSLGAAGRLAPEQLERLERLLVAPEVMARFRVLLVHYPLLDRHGALVKKVWRKLNGAEALLGLLERHPVDLVLHGHDHLRYVNPMQRSDGTRWWLYNSGSCAFHRGDGYPIKASFNLYDVEEGRLARVEHWDDSPEGFRQSYGGSPPTVRVSMSDIQAW